MHASGSIAQGVISWSGFGVVRFRLVFQPTNRLWRDKKLPAVPCQGLTQSVVRQSGSEVTLCAKQSLGCCVMLLAMSTSTPACTRRMLPRSWTRYAEAMFAIFAWQGAPRASSSSTRGYKTNCRDTSIHKDSGARSVLLENFSEPIERLSILAQALAQHLKHDRLQRQLDTTALRRGLHHADNEHVVLGIDKIEAAARAFPAVFTQRPCRVRRR